MEGVGVGVGVDPPCRNVTSLCYCCSDGPYLYHGKRYGQPKGGKYPSVGGVHD